MKTNGMRRLFEKSPGNKENFLKKVFLDLSKTLNSRKLRFRQEKGEQHLLSYTIRKPRPAPFWPSSDQPHSVQTVTQDCLNTKKSPFLAGGFLKKAPCTPKTFNSRKLRFRQRKGKDSVPVPHDPKATSCFVLDLFGPASFGPNRYAGLSLRRETVPLLSLSKRQTVKIRFYPSRWVHRRIKAVEPPKERRNDSPSVFLTSGTPNGVLGGSQRGKGACEAMPKACLSVA